DTMLNHCGKLQLVSRPRFVRRQRPRRRLEREIIIWLRLRGICRRDVERQDDLPLLTAIVDEPGRTHVRRGLLRALRRAGNPDPRWTIGQGYQVSGPDDLFELLQPLLVVRKDGISHELLLLQIANHAAVIGIRTL